MQLLLLSPNDQMKLCIVNNFSIVSLGECVTLSVIDFDTSDLVFRLFELVRLFSRVFVQMSFVVDARVATGPRLAERIISITHVIRAILL